MSALGGLVPGRFDEALLAVNKPPFSPPEAAPPLLSKSSQLTWQLVPLRGAILFFLPSSAPVIVLPVAGLLYSLQGEPHFRFCNS